MMLVTLTDFHAEEPILVNLSLVKYMSNQEGMSADDKAGTVCTYEYTRIWFIDNNNLDVSEEIEDIKRAIKVEQDRADTTGLYTVEIDAPQGRPLWKFSGMKRMTGVKTSEGFYCKKAFVEISISPRTPLDASIF